MRHHRITIAGEVWTYAMLSAERYESLYGSDSNAITEIEDKRISFMPNTATLPNIIHELFHAFSSYLCLDDTNEIKSTDFEEIYAGMMSKRSLTLLSCAAKMYIALHPGEEDSTLKQFIKQIKKLEKICLR